MWFNLAAAKDDHDFSKIARDARDALAHKMSRDQIAQAQEMARNWQPKAAQKIARLKVANWRTISGSTLLGLTANAMFCDAESAKSGPVNAIQTYT
jgi:hypothetical protein